MYSPWSGAPVCISFCLAELCSRLPDSGSLGDVCRQTPCVKVSGAAAEYCPLVPRGMICQCKRQFGTVSSVSVFHVPPRIHPEGRLWCGQRGPGRRLVGKSRKWLRDPSSSDMLGTTNAVGPCEGTVFGPTSGCGTPLHPIPSYDALYAPRSLLSEWWAGEETKR